MNLEELIHSVFEQITADKDAVLTRIVNGTFATSIASDTGMAYQHQRGLLLGLQRADDIIRATIKKLSEPRNVEGTGDVGIGTELAAEEIAKPRY